MVESAHYLKHHVLVSGRQYVIQFVGYEYYMRSILYSMTELRTRLGEIR